jgi:hypothetical protein
VSWGVGAYVMMCVKMSHVKGDDERAAIPIAQGPTKAVLHRPNEREYVAWPAARRWGTTAAVVQSLAPITHHPRRPQATNERMRGLTLPAASGQRTGGSACWTGR